VRWVWHYVFGFASKPLAEDGFYENPRRAGHDTPGLCPLCATDSRVREAQPLKAASIMTCRSRATSAAWVYEESLGSRTRSGTWASEMSGSKGHRTNVNS
jgi:hypothetical protein